MKALNNLKLIGMLMLLVVGLGACDKPGPAETAGEKIDRTADKAGQNIEKAFDKAGDAMSEQGAIAGMAIEDAEITTKIKAAILAEPGLKTLQIGVDTKNGVVTLSGSVDSQSSSDRAKELAGAVSGVKDVDNRLALKSNK